MDRQQQRKEVALLIKNADADMLTWITQLVLLRRFDRVAEEMVETFRQHGDRFVAEMHVDIPSMFTQADLLRITTQDEARGIVEDCLDKALCAVRRSAQEHLQQRFDRIWKNVIEWRKNEIRKRDAHRDN